jgi:hypothetical protein
MVIDDEAPRSRDFTALPSVERVAPTRWVDGLLAGHEVPQRGVCRRLSSAGRRLSREELVRVASSPHLSRLEELRLFDVGMGDDEARAFADACTLDRLTALSAPWNRIGPQGARALPRAPSTSKKR